MLKLLIKGHAYQAMNAASKRAISLHNIRVYQPGEICAETPEMNQARVIQWYGEPNAGAPFLPGTLLFFHAGRRASNRTGRRVVYVTG